MISISEKQRRQDIVEFAINNNAIKGLFVSDVAKQLLSYWVNGEMTLEQAEKKYMRYGSNDPYIYENGVLKNKLNIKVQSELDDKEKDITAF